MIQIEKLNEKNIQKLKDDQRKHRIKVRKQVEEEERVQKLRMAVPPTKVWKLNVEGTPISVSHETVTKVKDSDLAKIFEVPVKENNDEQLFFDRDYSKFKLMINYLRDGFKVPSSIDKVSLSNLEDELEHWKIPNKIKSDPIMNSARKSVIEEHK